MKSVETTKNECAESGIWVEVMTNQKKDRCIYDFEKNMHIEKIKKILQQKDEIFVMCLLSELKNNQRKLKKQPIIIEI